MRNYLDLVQKVLVNGHALPPAREGQPGRKSLFGEQLRFDCKEVPIMTTKKLYWKSVRKELLWFLRGETNVSTLGCSIWDKWADSKGECGPIYGKQWRDWNGIDQIGELVQAMKERSTSRRLLVSAWNVGELGQMSLVPCHCLFQVHIVRDEFVLHLYQRSADLMVGVPFNILSYYMLMHWLELQTGLRKKELVITFGDVHIYDDHVDGALEQLRREPLDRKAVKLDGLLNVDGQYFSHGPIEFMVHE